MSLPRREVPPETPESKRYHHGLVPPPCPCCEASPFAPFASPQDLERAREYLAVGPRLPAMEVSRQWFLRADGPDYQPHPVVVVPR